MNGGTDARVHDRRTLGCQKLYLPKARVMDNKIELIGVSRCDAPQSDAVGLWTRDDRHGR